MVGNIRSFPRKHTSFCEKTYTLPVENIRSSAGIPAFCRQNVRFRRDISALKGLFGGLFATFRKEGLSAEPVFCCRFASFRGKTTANGWTVFFGHVCVSVSSVSLSGWFWLFARRLPIPRARAVPASSRRLLRRRRLPNCRRGGT